VIRATQLRAPPVFIANLPTAVEARVYKRPEGAVALPHDDDRLIDIPIDGDITRLGEVVCPAARKGGPA